MLDVKERGGWAARSRQRCVGVVEKDLEGEDSVAAGPPVVPEKAQASMLTTEELTKHLDANSRYADDGTCQGCRRAAEFVPRLFVWALCLVLFMTFDNNMLVEN